jgi:hypothetical protein
MQLNIEISKGQLTELLLKSLSEKIASSDIFITSSSGQAPDAMPPIGAYWEGQGGIFAGIMRGRDGGKDYFLIKGPNIDGTDWKNMLDSAASIEVDGHRDFRLPYRAEQSLLYANLREHFEKKWYWSCEQHPGDSACAYAQGFEDGYQYYVVKDDECLGCAIRMIPIE